MYSDSSEESDGGAPPSALKETVAAPTGSTPPPWVQDAMQVYHNDLFTDTGSDDGSAHPGERVRLVTVSAAPSGSPGVQGRSPLHAQGGGSQPSSSSATPSRSTLAARRAERLQASVYQANSSPLAPGRGPQPPPSRDVSTPSSMQTAQDVVGSNAYGLRMTYDPDEDSSGVSTRIASWRPASAPLDVSNLPLFLTQPGPLEGEPIMCYIVRDTSGAKNNPRYNLYLEDPKMFLLAGKKRSKKTTSNYVVALDPEDLNRDDARPFGRLRANFVGTEFTIFDGGEKPSSRTPRGTGANERRELGAVTYEYNVLGTRGPRKMMGVIPALDPAGQCLFRPTGPTDTLLDRVKAERGLRDLVIMHNKPPRWNEELNAYCLNFNGRVTEASVKNFQLVTKEDPNHVILQFGKIGKNTFTMDYMWPMTALQAFSICLSAFDNKLACE